MKKQVGSRIRKIRLHRNLTQSQLAEKLGLTGDRIQKYENGQRNPKEELLDRFAKALHVRPEALREPNTTDTISVMHILFRLEEEYGLHVEEINGSYHLKFGNGKSGIMSMYLSEWYKELKNMEKQEHAAESTTEAEAAKNAYCEWKWNFPRPVCEEDN